MPGFDEEFAKEAEGKASQMAMRFMYSMPHRARPAANGLGLAGKRRRSRERIDALDAQARADREAIAAAWERHEAGGGAEPEGIAGHAAGDVAFRTLAATTPEGAAAISSMLSEHGVEHYADVPAMLSADPDSDRMAGFAAGPIGEAEFERAGRAESGLYEVYLPDRDAPAQGVPTEYPYRALVAEKGGYTPLSELPNLRHAPGEAGIRAFIAEHDIEAVKERLALNAACAQSRGEVAWSAGNEPPQQALDELGIDFPGLGGDGFGKTFTLELETVSWDPEGRIVADALDELGVPHADEVAVKAERGAPGLVKIEVPEMHAGYVKQAVDEMARGGKIRGFTLDRLNYDELAAAAEDGVAPGVVYNDRVFRSHPLPRDAMHKVTCALQELGVEHVIEEVPEDGTFTVMVKESDYRLKAGSLNRAGETLERVRPPEFSEQAQRAYEQSAQVGQNRERVRRRLEAARAKERADQAQRQRRARVSRDVKEATKSAEAQRRAVADTVRRHAIGR